MIGIVLILVAFRGMTTSIGSVNIEFYHYSHARRCRPRAEFVRLAVLNLNL